ncbi:hypothetical protein OG746_23785 [Streptomyces sp. NBC_01016]|uniref:hypothetical protein n=1 Tax=Streptomyces sp. NBC_01016 TaxID=2903720 RepID=UPI002257FFBB|nr:hypothetical protein [Streptomyces sp. NBC_01016]MCX4831765.1 hypothetical protein [Streptomyces sp. NBC_01016]
MTNDDHAPERLAQRARDLTREDRRSDHRLFWLELVAVLLVAVLLVAGVLVARWLWLL